MAASPARRGVPASYGDLSALPPHVVGEILAGELHATPRPRIEPFDAVEIDLNAIWSKG